ncbi:MAG: aminotransferase class I/II-fold pyridoxal phosphate-dependent enzyme [Bacteroidia bacterium]|nr:aminotransferase class I/II-fold pyridoxal phosphate-dependent enzyme [Bacteroidia bacterium]
MNIDLRSDTVTKPSAEMLKVMMNAEVGDDVFNEDPTVNKLQEKTAALFGMEAGLFCASGTMTNQLAIKAHTQPGEEVICDMNSHIYHHETGGMAFNSGVQAKLLPGDRGRLNAKQIEAAINPDFDWLTATSLVSLENTVNKAGGSYYELNEIKKISEMCREKKLKFHLDGARIFNALVETGEQPKQYGELFDSISVCLSKGLGAPVGSLILGKKDFIKKCRRFRKTFGGNMRQAGYLAAAGIYALDNNVSRLKEDHAKAKAIANALTKVSYVKNVLPAETNIVIFDLDDTMPMEQFVKKMNEHGIKFAPFGPQTVRFVTHLDFTDEMLEIVLKSF